VLLADLDDVPAEVVDEIRAGRWRFVSIEVLADAVKNGERYDWVPSGLALLGSARPACDVLKPLHESLSRRVGGGLTFRAAHAFTHALSRGGAMATEVDGLRTQLRAQEQRLILLTFQSAIREGKCTPAARETFMRRFRDAGTLADATAWIADAPRAPTRRAMTTAADGNDNRALYGVRADHALVALTRIYLDEHEVKHFTLTGQRLTFAEAARQQSLRIRRTRRCWPNRRKFAGPTELICGESAMPGVFASCPRRVARDRDAGARCGPGVSISPPSSCAPRTWARVMCPCTTRACVRPHQVTL
jgi:hypothetical protein